MAIYNILSFDPGLTTMGYAHSSYDTDTSILTVHRFGTFKSSKMAGKQKELSALFGTRIIAVDLLENEIRRLIDLFKPDYIASEDVFCHFKHITAFAALSICLHSMKHAAYTKNKTIYTMAPCTIKKITSEMGKADKSAIQSAILNHPRIIVIDNKSWPIEKMCEHEADAIAVGYTFCNTILPNILIAKNLNDTNTIEVVLDPLYKKKKKSTEKIDKTKISEETTTTPVEYNTTVENSSGDIEIVKVPPEQASVTPPKEETPRPQPTVSRHAKQTTQTETKETLQDTQTPTPKQTTISTSTKKTTTHPTVSRHAKKTTPV